ncbi:tumor necrosis factor receptor superfamily member 14-like [Rousettus aegyptiacus]|nr:tumor necrosis factor receptor superfamily member 14-like [Rousettus aegyptiacus]
MERLPGGGLRPWGPAPRAVALSLMLCLLLVRSQCAPVMSPSKENKCPEGAECKPDKGLATRRKCFGTENTVCGCDQGHYCMTKEGDNCTRCQPHSVCGPGQWVLKRGTEWQDTECADYPPGTFSPDGTLAEYQPPTNCSGPFQTAMEPGTQSTDATCSFSWVFYVLCPSLFVFGVIVGALVLWRTVKSRRSRGLYAPTRARLQVNGVTAASQVLPDVTPMAGEEMTSMVPERDRAADTCLWDANV